MTPRVPGSFGTGGQRFGTGGDPETVVKTEGPGIIRTIINGAAFATGFMLVGFAAKKLGEAFSGSDADVEQYDDEGYLPSDYAEVSDRKAERARAKRLKKLDIEDDED